MKALNPFAPFWYTCMDECEEKADGSRGDPLPGATRFKLRGLDGQQLGYLTPEFTRNEQGMISGLSGKGADLALRYGLLDWENFANDSGEVAFNIANFNLIPFTARSELGMQIIAASFVKPDEKKIS